MGAVGAAGSAGMAAVMSGNGGSAGMTGGNTSGSGGGGNVYTSDPTFATGMHCPNPTQTVITDFTPVAPAAADAGLGGGADAAPAASGPIANLSFGDFTSTFSGSTFVYPNMGAYQVHSDVSGGNWHVTGTLGDYSGFGISFGNCYSLDASAYQGISFTVQGSVPMGSTITFGVGTAADETSHVWLNANTNPMPPALPNAGRCLPAVSQYDGSCTAPSHAVPVTAERTTVKVLWADLTAGRPAATVDSKEITNMAWTFPAPAGAGTTAPTTYDVDVTIDDLQFIAP
jgi:hypothetical protein